MSSIPLLLLVQMEEKALPTPHSMVIPAASTVGGRAVTASATADPRLLLSGTQVSSCDVFLARQEAQ